MRSPDTFTLCCIICALHQTAVMGRVGSFASIYIYRPFPTSSPTAAPSFSSIPTLLPSLAPTSSPSHLSSHFPSYAPTAPAPLLRKSSNLANPEERAKSSVGIWVAIPLTLIFASIVFLWKHYTRTSKSTDESEDDIIARNKALQDLIDGLEDMDDNLFDIQAAVDKTLASNQEGANGMKEVKLGDQAPAQDHPDKRDMHTSPSPQRRIDDRKHKNRRKAAEGEDGHKHHGRSKGRDRNVDDQRKESLVNGNGFVKSKRKHTDSASSRISTKQGDRHLPSTGTVNDNIQKRSRRGERDRKVRGHSLPRDATNDDHGGSKRKERGEPSRDRLDKSESRRNRSDPKSRSRRDKRES